MRIKFPLIVLIFWLGCGRDQHQQIPTFKVKVGEFFVNVVETGELKATRSLMITAPAIDWSFGDLKISKIIDDGTSVQQGDTLILFDQADVQKAIIDARTELEIAQAEFAKAEADQKSRIEELEADLKMAEISYEIAKLELEQATYEADIRKKEIELKLEQSQISLNKAKEEITNQKKINAEDLHKIQLKIDQLNANLKNANDTLAKLTITAQNPGLVIIEKNWMSGNKWQVGDQPWGGWPLMSLPDLNEISATAEINEVDISKVQVGQEVRIKLDANPDTSFSAKVTNIAILAKQKDEKSKVKVFPVDILIAGTHELLRPGMTVSCDIVVDKLDSVVFIPLDGLFKKEAQYHAYLQSGRTFKIHPVKIDIKNNDYVVVTEGLKTGDVIALVEPASEKKPKDQKGAKQKS